MRFVWFALFALFVWSAHSRTTILMETGANSEGILRLALAGIGCAYFGWMYFITARKDARARLQAKQEKESGQDS